MKHFFLLAIFTSLTHLLYAQQVHEADKSAAMNLVQANLSKLGLSPEDMNKLDVSSSYGDEKTRIRYVYLIQTYLDIPVYNQYLVLSFRDNQLLSKAGEMKEQMSQRVDLNSGVPVIGAAQSVAAALRSKKVNVPVAPVLISRSSNGQREEFDKNGLTLEKITAELLWYPADGDSNYRLAWQVFISPIGDPDYWYIYIDALDGKVLDSTSLTVHDHWGSGPSGDPGYPVLPGHTEATNTFLPGKNNENLVNISAYRVVPFPASNPLAPGGAPALRINPWQAAPGDATTLKWHRGTDGTDYNYTRGNNVWAYHDRTSNNLATVEKSATSTTGPDPLTFDFIPNFTVDPTQSSPVQNQQFNITNLFYWNNIIHDVMYQYGFTEAAGNYQADNLDRGGLGNDPILAEAQDGGGINNANFSPTPDGISGRIQMFLYNRNGSSPFRDSDVDNEILVHEYAHGISNRLTGGPATSSCLLNAEHMGEGWSDYYGLMFTQDWAASTVYSGAVPRGMASYASNTTKSTGIRSYPYSTSMIVNPLVYSANLPSPEHARGEIWCTTLWDMTWAIIEQVGWINPNLYDAAGGGGNNIALRLVTEGMKLQPCSPGFINGRDAIIQADINLYGGVHVCAIKEAFRRRGMGEGALQGSPHNVNDQVPSYEKSGPTLSLLQQGISATREGQNIVYINRLSATTLCEPVVNFMLQDTLPANVDFVSVANWGSYDVNSRVISWPVNLLAGETKDFGFTVNVKPGSYYTPHTILDEQVTSSNIPASWIPGSTTSLQWGVESSAGNGNQYKFASPGLASVSDQTLTTTNAFALPVHQPVLSFWHSYDTEPGYDGGVVEISTNGGTTWTDIGANKFISGAYKGFITNANSNPALRGRRVFSGSSDFSFSSIALKDYAGQANVKLRFRFASDHSIGSNGWQVDDILLTDIASVYMRSALYSASGNTRLVADSVMRIIANSGPLVSLSGILLPFETCSGFPSAEQIVKVSGTLLTAPVKLSVPPGFEISTISGSGYSPFIFISPVGGSIVNRDIFIRLSSSATGNSYGSLSATSPGALPAEIMITGTLQGYNNSSQEITNNHGLHFDGVNDYVSIKPFNTGCSAQPWNLKEAITIEYWFKGTVLTSAVRLQNPLANGFIISGYPMINGGFIHMLSNDGGFNGVHAGAAVTDGNWHHVAMTWQKGTVNGFTSYLDGQVVAQRNSSANDLPSVNLPFILGSYLGSSEFMNGSLDELRIWNVCRTQAEIQANMQTLPAVSQTGLLVYYKFDHGIANGNNGFVNAVSNSVNPFLNEGRLFNFSLNGSSSNWVGPAVNIPRYYVKPGGDDANNGTSWATAFKTLQKALAASVQGNSIWVAAGTYYADEGPGIINNDRNAFFALKNGVNIYGGFAGNEENLSQRNLFLNTSIISGEIQQDNDISNNTNSIFRNTNADVTAVLDGFSIVGGSAVSGGGAMLNNNASPTIRNCIFINNTAPGAGAVLHNTNSNPVFTNCVFRDNGNALVGGAVAFNSGSAPRFMNCSFAGNQAANGSMMFSQASSFPVLTNCIAWGNYGAGAVFGTTGTSGVTITYSIVQGGFPGAGNSPADPLFTDAAAGNLSLRSCSPAINTGTVAGAAEKDVLGFARPAAGAIDMGAYEKQIIYGDIIYVKSNAAGSSSGLNWSNAFTRLQDALQVASSDSCIKEIWTAAGIYKPTAGTDRNISFSMKNNLAVYGGFNGTQFLLSQRRVNDYATILSGDIGVANDISDNSFHVIFNDNNALNETAILDGFTITGGNANVAGANTEDGGGIFNRNASPLIRNCIFRENQARYGGAISNYPASPSVLNSKFLGNQALVQGGAVFNEQTAIFTNCIFTGNVSAISGGAMANNVGSAVVITNCSFSGNSSANPGAIFNFDSNPVVSNCLLWGNDAGILNGGSSTPVVNYSIIQGGYTGTGNLNVNPLFLEQPPIGLGTNGNLQLLACSPAVNTGTATNAPASDIAGNPRPALGAVDIGAYEQQAPLLNLVYVDSSARGRNDGSSWTNAFTDVRHAIAQVNICDPTLTLYVAKGTYTTPASTTYDFNKLNAIILGGYPTGGGTRNAAANPVILKGNINVFKSLQMDGIEVMPGL